MNDFLNVFLAKLNALDSLPYTVKIGFPDADAGIFVYPVPGGQIIEGYMTGEKLISLPFQITIKSLSQKEAFETLWAISDVLKDETITYTSANESFSFEQILMNNEPFMGGLDEHNYFIYQLDFSARMITN